MSDVGWSTFLFLTVEAQYALLNSEPQKPKRNMTETTQNEIGWLIFRPP